MGFNAKSLQKCLGGESYDVLAGAALNAGANFLNGQVSNAFNKFNSAVTNNETLSKITEAGISGFGAYEVGKSIAADPTVIAEFASSIIQEAISSVTSGAAQQIGDVTSYITTKTVSVPQEITQYAAAYFSTNKKSLGECIKEALVSNPEQKIDEEAEKQQKSKISDTVKKADKKAKKFFDKVYKGIDKSMEQINNALNYIENGPDWLAAEVDKQINNSLKFTGKYVDKCKNVVGNELDQFSKKTGEEIGEWTVEKYNSVLEKQAKKLINKQQKTIAKARIKAAMTKQKAKVKLTGMIGL